MAKKISKKAFQRFGVSEAGQRETAGWRALVDQFESHVAFIVGEDCYSGDVSVLVEMWLENPQSFMLNEDGSVNRTGRLRTGGDGLHRHDPLQHKQASESGWHSDVREVTSHVNNLLASLGNARR
jgi:hypothetical protein